MAKLYLLVLCLALCCQCRQARDTGQEGTTQEARLQLSGLPKKIPLTPGARELVSDWPEYLELENSLDELSRVETREDLRLLLDELLEKEKALAASDYPDLFDAPQVKGREKVFKTYLLKAKAQLEYRQNPMAATGEMMTAYNVLCDELNTMVRGTLDRKLLSDEN